MRPTKRMSRSREVGVEHLDHLPALIGLLDTVSGTARDSVREGHNHTLTDSGDVPDRNPGLLLDGGLDLRDLPRGERLEFLLDLRGLPRTPAGQYQRRGGDRNQYDGCRQGDE